MSSRFLILLTTLVVVLSPSLVSAQEKPTSDEYRQSLSTLLDLTGAKMAGEQIAYAIAQETLGAIAATGTPITEQIQQVVVDEALGEFASRYGDLDYLTDLYIPLYAEHLTEKDMRELLAFYQSPLGKKTLDAMPSIAQNAAVLMQKSSFEQIPGFQQKVDTKLRALGVVVTP